MRDLRETSVEPSAYQRDIIDIIIDIRIWCQQKDDIQILPQMA